MKRIRYLFRYIKLLKQNKEILLNTRVNDNPSGIRYDWLYRLYTVVNLPQEDEQNVKRYGWKYVDEMVKSHIVKINEFLFGLGILEYVEVDTKSIVQLDETNVKIVLRFKWINLKLMVRLIVYGIPTLLLLASLILIMI